MSTQPTILLVDDDPEEPCLETAAVAVGRPVFQDADEDVLDEVIGRGPVAGHPTQEIEQRDVIALEEEAQLGQVSIADCGHQGLVGHGQHP